MSGNPKVENWRNRCYFVSVALLVNVSDVNIFFFLRLVEQLLEFVLNVKVCVVLLIGLYQSYNLVWVAAVCLDKLVDIFVALPGLVGVFGGYKHGQLFVHLV